MHFKQLFKPDIKKIILSLILFLVFVPFINYDTEIRCIQAPCPSSGNASIMLYLLLYTNSHIYSINFFILFIGIVFSYLISGIIFGYKKVKV